MLKQLDESAVVAMHLAVVVSQESKTMTMGSQSEQQQQRMESSVAAEVHRLISTQLKGAVREAVEEATAKAVGAALLAFVAINLA